MKGLKVPAFWQAVIIVTFAYLIFDNAFPPLMPRSLLTWYMIIIVIGVVLYFACDEERWTEFKGPIAAILRDDGKWLTRWAFLIFIPILLGLVVFNRVKPSFEPPLELRQAHPAPPSNLSLYGQNYDLSSLENPVRMGVLSQLETDPDAAMKTYQAAVRAGSEVYYQDCFYCHGDLLDGQGPYAKGLFPLPANFQDVGTIAQLQESYLFWRITTGGTGLPKGGTPWNSSMPAWHEMLSEEDVWNVIIYLYDTVGQVPRMWDPEISKNVTSMKQEIQSQRAKMGGVEIYQFRCAMCHGEQGAADMPVAERLYPKPRDFTLGLFKFKTSPGELPPRDEDLFQVIKDGLEGTSMPGWSTVLTDEQIKSLIPVIKSFDVYGTWAPEDAEDEDFSEDGHYLKSDYIVITDLEPTDGQIPYNPESIARGREVFLNNCKECHGEEGRGNITSDKRLEDDRGDRIWPRDLTSPWFWWATDVAGNDAAGREETIRNIYTRATIGIPGTPMPALRSGTPGEKDPVSLEDRWHLANYVYTLHEKSTPPGGSTVIKALEVTGTLPVSMTDPAWNKATATTLLLVPNMIKAERLFTPLNDAMTVRVLYNDSEIAFLLEVIDRTDSRPGEPVSTQIQDEKLTMYADAIAIQFPREGAYEVAPAVEKPLYQHGDGVRPTTIWYWNAGSVDPPAAARAMLLDASGPDKKLVARENDNSLTAFGTWQGGRWRVVMKRPRDGSVTQDVSFREGQFIPVSFANWDGSNGEVGSRHTLTNWYWLLLPPETDYATIYGIPAGTVLGTFLMGIVLIRNQRRKK